MNSEKPPIHDPEPDGMASPTRPVNLARLGLWLSLVAPSVIALMVVFQPG